MASECRGRFVLLTTLALAGCGVPRNESPVSFGVPDGMVLGRDVVGASAIARAEVVTFACADQRMKAYVWTPLPLTGKPARVEFTSAALAWPKASPGDGPVVVVADPGDLSRLKEAAQAMAASLAE